MTFHVAARDLYRIALQMPRRSISYITGPLCCHISRRCQERRFMFLSQKGLMIAKKADSLPNGFLTPAPMPNAKLQWLAIQAKDGKWHWADGKIEGSELLVSAKGVKEPKAVRYAYTTQPLGNLLYNKDGMPVGPFTTCGYDSSVAE